MNEKSRMHTSDTDFIKNIWISITVVDHKIVSEPPKGVGQLSLHVLQGFKQSLRLYIPMKW